MEFARMDSLSRLFPSDLEFQSGRISFRFCSRSKFKSKRQSILIDITLLARYPSILILLSPLPSFVSGNFRGKSNSTHFFFFWRSTRRKENVEEDWNKPNFIPERRRKHLLARASPQSTDDIFSTRIVTIIVIKTRFESNLDELRISTLLEGARGEARDFSFSFLRQNRWRRAGSLLVFHRLFFSLGLATDSFVRVNGSRASFSRISV